MFKKIGRIILWILLALILLAAVTAIISPPLVRRTAKKSFPTVDGQIQIQGLDGQVEIYRDAFGIPHIYAETQHDLYFAQGYVHAQDRFWQMDFWRHQGAGSGLSVNSHTLIHFSLNQVSNQIPLARRESNPAGVF